MGDINPLLNLPASADLLNLPARDRRAIALILRQLRDQANDQAEEAWRRRAAMAAYWRAVSTYARHLAHALEQQTRTT